MSSQALSDPVLRRLLRVDLNLLVALVVLVEARHVSRAAKRLGLSQPATSRSLARLRDMFGDLILAPVGRTFVPTRRGLALAAEATLLLSALHAHLEHPAFDPRTLRRTFIIVADDYFECFLLPPMLARLRDIAPDVSIRVAARVAGSARTVESGERDMYVRVAPPAGARWHVRPLFEDAMVCVSPAPIPATLEELAACRHVVIDWGEGVKTVSDELLESRGLERRVVAALSSYLPMPDVLWASGALAIVPARVAARFLRTHPFHCGAPPFGSWRGLVRLYWHELHDADPAHAWFRGILCDIGMSLPVPSLADLAALRSARACATGIGDMMSFALPDHDPSATPRP